MILTLLGFGVLLIICSVFVVNARLKGKVPFYNVKTNAKLEAPFFLSPTWGLVKTVVFKSNEDSRAKSIENAEHVPGVSATWLGWIPALTVASPQALQQVLSHKTTDKRVFSRPEKDKPKPKPKSTFGKNVAGRMMGDSLVLKPDSDAMPVRKIMKPAFTNKKLYSLLPTFNSVTEEMLSLIDALPLDQPVNIFDYMKKLTFDIIGLTGFGHNFHSLTKLTRERNNFDIIFKNFLNPLSYLLGSWVNKLPFSKTIMVEKAITETNEMLASLIQQRRQQKREGSDPDLLDMILEADENNVLTQDELQHNTFLFMLAGFETSAGTMTALLHFLAKYPETQEKVYSEIVTVIGKDGRVTEDNIGEFKYLPAALKEAMRLVPAAGSMTPRIAMEDMILDDIFVPKGTIMFFDFISAHYRAIYWNDPLKFKPERFIENPKDWQKVFSFSQGPRICIGHKFATLEMIVVIARLLQRYHIALIPGWQWTYEASLIVAPVGGLPLMLTKRS